MQIKQKWCWGQEHSHFQDKMQMENLFTVAKNQNTQQEQYSLCKCINMMQFSQAMRQWDRSFIYSLLQLHTLPPPPPPPPPPLPTPSILLSLEICVLWLVLLEYMY